MLVNYESMALGPSYAFHGTSAVLTDKAGTSRPVTVSDHRDGVETELFGDRDPGYSGTVAAVFIRRSEQPTKPIGWTLSIDGESYLVRNAVRQGGEWILALQEAE